MKSDKCRLCGQPVKWVGGIEGWGPHRCPKGKALDEGRYFGAQWWSQQRDLCLDHL